MIEEYGQVRDAARGKLAVEILTPGSCDSCPIHDSCYATGKVVWVPGQEGITINDHVRFSITNTSVLRISALVYGLPLLGVIGGILAGYLWLFGSLAEDPRILASVGLGAALFATAGFVISKLDSSMKNRLTYHVVRVQENTPTLYRDNGP